MVGAGEYKDISEATAAIVKTKDVVLPDPIIAAAYQEKYRVFRQAYPALKGVFAQI